MGLLLLFPPAVSSGPPAGVRSLMAFWMGGAALYTPSAPTTPTTPPAPVEPTYGSGPQPHSRRPPFGIVTDGGWRQPLPDQDEAPDYGPEADRRHAVADSTRAPSESHAEAHVQLVLRMAAYSQRPAAVATGALAIDNEEDWLRGLP